MSSHVRSGEPPPGVEYLGFDHLHFWVGNAHQAAAYYITRFAFEPYAYRGLETGSRQITTQVIRQNKIIFAFSSALTPNNHQHAQFLSLHGDGVRDVALCVLDCEAAYTHALSRGAHSVRPPESTTDGSGSVTLATIASAVVPDLHHTFVQRRDYTGTFLPGFVAAAPEDAPSLALVGDAGLGIVDHCVANLPDGKLAEAAQWYEHTLGWHRFWSVDDKQLHTEYSSLRSIVVADFHERVKMPLNEPASGRQKSQIQEYVDYFGGAGIQHIALRTNDVIRAVECLRGRGVGFITVPKSYYDDLRVRLGKSSTKVREDLADLERLGILLDFDESGYLLQTFTKPVQDRPTVFLEIIQRYTHQGFGVNNFKSLFEAIEKEQALRGNLWCSTYIKFWGALSKLS